MDPFYTTIVVVALIVLVVFLVIMGLMMQYQNNQTVYPGTQNQCPDYWIAGVNTDKQTTCTPQTQGLNTFTLPTTGTPSYVKGGSILPNDPGWQTGGTSSICGQRAWASKNNISWDGVTNYNSC